MNFLNIVLNNTFAFILLLSIVVFVHEFGHYIVAILNGVQVDEFAIGYGKELWSKTDKRGTKWKICLLPFGGFCKFFGDEDESSSSVDKNNLNKLSENDKKKCLYFKNVWQKIAVVSAGPIFNYILAIIFFTTFFAISGKGIVGTKVTKVIKDSAAYKSGILINDKIIKIDNDKMKDFAEIQFKIALNKNKNMVFEIFRNDEIININVEPKIKEKKDIFGKKIQVQIVGIESNDINYVKLNFAESIKEAFIEVYTITKNTLIALGQMITGKRGLDDISGPIKIAQYSGKYFEGGFCSFIFFVALISTSLGLMNLLPIPVLDGGHIVMYLIEAIRGKELSEKMQNILFKIGLGILSFLMIFAILKDLIGIFK